MGDAAAGFALLLFTAGFMGWAVNAAAAWVHEALR
jgi:hypothetical protein